jgi:hypothetical protein
MSEHDMTIAQALRHVKKLKGRIDEARTRAVSGVSFFDDSPPAFSFEEQYERAVRASVELAELQGRLAVANSSNFVDYADGKITLSHAVRILQELRSEIAWIRGIASKPQRQTHDMVSVYVPGQGHMQQARPVSCLLPEAEKARRAERLQDKFDALNAAVEVVNQVAKV